MNEHRVEYLLIGGYAVGYHGYPRSTGDLDIWISATTENAAKMVAVLNVFGFETPDVVPDLFTAPSNIVRLGHPPLRLEIMTSISGVAFAEAYGQKVTDLLDGIAVDIISLDQLKANKRASGRLRDLSDLENLP